MYNVHNILFLSHGAHSYLRAHLIAIQRLLSLTSCICIDSTTSSLTTTHSLFPSTTSLTSSVFIYSRISVTFPVSSSKIQIQQNLSLIHQSSFPTSPLSPLHKNPGKNKTHLLLYGFPFFCVAYPLHSTTAFKPIISISSTTIFNGVAKAFTNGARIFSFQDSTFCSC
jgi:hypothetical protein